MRRDIKPFIGNGFENQSHDIIFDNGFKLVADLLKENGDVFLEFTECMPVEGEKVVGRVIHLGINTDAAVTVIENEAVHLLTVILPHDPSVRDHPLEELWELEPESLGFPDCKVTMSAITAGIDHDTLVNVKEISREASLKIDAVMTSLAFNHFHMLFL